MSNDIKIVTYLIEKQRQLLLSKSIQSKKPARFLVVDYGNLIKICTDTQLKA